MAEHVVKLPIKYATYQELQRITAALNAGEKKSMSAELGDVFTQMTCEVLDTVFAELIRTQSLRATPSSGESQKVLEQISEQLQKYLPMAIKLFSNDRLLPVANYILSKFKVTQEQAFLCYDVPTNVIKQAKTDYIHLQQGKKSAVQPVFSHLVKIIDLGVTALIREPKEMLKFNFIMDKTLNGVLGLATSLGYKRIEKIGTILEIDEAQNFARHFNQYIHLEQQI